MGAPSGSAAISSAIPPQRSHAVSAGVIHSRAASATRASSASVRSRRAPQRSRNRHAITANASGRIDSTAHCGSQPPISPGDSSSDAHELERRPRERAGDPGGERTREQPRAPLPFGGQHAAAGERQMRALARGGHRAEERDPQREVLHVAGRPGNAAVEEPAQHELDDRQQHREQQRRRRGDPLDPRERAGEPPDRRHGCGGLGVRARNSSRSLFTSATMSAGTTCPISFG